ncbi:MAG: PAS domain S-box protein [Halobacteriota archaeon]
MATDIPINVLLIEDNPTDVRLVQEILRGAPSDHFNIISASTLAQGLDHLSSDHVDIILLDLGLPDSQGLDTFQTIEEHASDLPIIILTVSANEELGLRAIRAGAQRFFSKDVLTPDGAYAEVFPQVIYYAIEQKRAEAELQKARGEVEKLNEELCIANEKLEHRVQERTEELTAVTASLRESEARYRSLVERNFDGVIIHSDGIIRYANDAAARIMKAQSPDELIGMPALDIATPRYRELLAQRVQEIFRTHASSELVEVQISACDGTIVDIEMSGTLVTYEGKPAIYIMARDISARKRMEAQLKQYAARAEEHARKQDILTQVITAGNKAADLQSALVAMLDTALELLSLDNGGVFLRDSEAMTLQYERGYTAEQRAWTQRIPITQRRIARIMDGTPWISDDYQADVTPEVREMNKDVASMATVPLMAGDAVVGFYQLVSLRHSRHFTDEERALLVTIGREAGTIIARLQAEAALRESETRYRHLVEESFDAVLIHSDDIIQFANDNAAHILKAPSAEALIGMNILDIPAPSYRALAQERVKQIYKSRQSAKPADFQYTALDGTIVDVEALGTPIIYHGRPASYLVFRDISDRKRMEAQIKQYSEHLEDVVNERTAQLAQREEQYRTLVETANSLIFTLDTEGTITYVNEFGAHSLGYTSDELIGHNVMILVPDTESSGRDMTRYINDIVARPEEHTVSVNENVTKDGRRLWFNWVNKILTDEEGHHIGHLSIGNDVTEQLRAEVALRDSEERYRTLVETAHSIILTVDNTGIITFINDYGAHFFGYTPDELIGKHTMILVPPVESTGRDLTAHIDDVIAHPDKHTMSLNENITRDGRRVLINWVNHILMDREGHHIGHLTMGYDVTEQKRAEDALRNAQRLAGIGQTAAMIGHDLRNPLQGLQYIVDLQKLRFERMPPTTRSKDDWQKEQVLFDRISEQIFYMDKIVGDLQDFARPMTPEHEQIRLHAIIDDALQSLPRADGVEVLIDVGDLTINADPHFMHRVFANVILNAMQAMPHGGRLTISAIADDGSVAIHVSDTGIGIPADMRDKLFSPLTTGKAKGTGLGLAVVKRIIEAHNGTITFESEKGKGTTFTVTLPQTAE